MATYKVIQDIEAEDKLLGPLTLRQFIYAAIVCVMGFVAFKLAAISLFLIIPFILPMGFFGLLAAPFGQDQSSEVWLLAKIRFMLKPRKRIWNQDGMQQLVSITVPKKVEKHLTDGLTQTEVKSRLNALANTIDSRGWAVKNVNVNMSNQNSYVAYGQAVSDRLVEGTTLPQTVPSTEILAADDILDPKNNPTAQHLDAMINQSTQSHRNAVASSIQNGQTPSTAQPADYWFLNLPTEQADQSANSPKLKPGFATFDSGPSVYPGTADSNSAIPQTNTEDEKHLLEKIREDKSKPNPAYGHMKVLKPTDSKPVKHPKHKVKHAEKTPPSTHSNMNPDAIRLAGNNDLNVSTIAREAEKSAKLSDNDEVVITLR